MNILHFVIPIKDRYRNDVQYVMSLVQYLIVM